MSEKRKWDLRTANVIAVLLMAVAVGLIVIMAVGLLFGGLVMLGAVKAEMLNGGALAALFLAALLGGVFACVRLKCTPLIWGVCVGLLLFLICLAMGAMAYGAGTLTWATKRVVAAVLGGGAAGVLSALLRK